jgi:hypothetical protein
MAHARDEEAGSAGSQAVGPLAWTRTTGGFDANKERSGERRKGQ